MTAYSKTAFKGLYGASSGSFNNTLAATITGSTLQTFSNDLADSALFVDSFQNTDQNYFEQQDYIQAPTAAVGWAIFTSGAGAGAASIGAYGIDATERAQGVIYSETGTTAAGIAIVYRGGIKFGLGQAFRLRKRIAVETLGNVGENYTVYFGFGDILSAGTDQNNGAYFRYNYNVNSGKVEAVTASGGVRTATDTGVTMDTTYHVYEIRVNSTGTSVDFYIDGANLKTNTTNIPTASFVYNLHTISKSAGTTTRKLDEDYYDFTMNLASTR
ncbi:MAG TPA: hypothetical protein PK059_02095 [Cyclobacteriaceae bacterium]|nr:hypothetical protein [Cyclobacteriaceae bacterium]